MRVKCEICGDVFEGRTAAKRCKDCAAVYKSAYQRLFQRARVRGEKIVAAEVHAYAAEQARAAASLRKSLSREGRCRFCGQPLPPHRSGDYCSACVRTGLHWVNAQTGRTNGWDRFVSTTKAKEPTHGIP